MSNIYIYNIYYIYNHIETISLNDWHSDSKLRTLTLELESNSFLGEVCCLWLLPPSLMLRSLKSSDILQNLARIETHGKK